MTDKLKELLCRAREAFENMSLEERDKMFRKQRASWVWAELGFGSDTMEAAYCEALTRGNAAVVTQLDAEGELRVSRVDLLPGQKS